jgi:hypothetical protein
MGMNALIFNVLKELGINPDRFSLQWASAAEAPRFVKLITEFTDKIKKLGPLGESEGIGPDELQAKLKKGLAAVSSRKVRMVYGNTAKSIRKEAIFTEEYISGVIEEKLSKAISGALSAEAEDESKAEPEKQAAPAKPAPAAGKAPKEEKAPAKKGSAEAKPAPKAEKKKKSTTKKKATAPKKSSAPKKKAAAKKTAAKKKK